jgi:enterochelin esterase-like enzyme
VHNHRVGRDDRLLVWLPPQYDAPAYAHRKFPVLMFLAGQPSTPQVVFRQFHFADVATKAVTTGQVPPFIAVFPTLMIDPPRDTECTDIPGGPRAESWLSQDVPAFLTSHFRARPLGRDWATMGWSTGGFCASKLVTSHPSKFASAVGFGAYYQPIEDHTTGNLFRGHRRLELHNSPQWMYLHHNGLHQGRLLIVAGRQDKESWLSSQQMLTATAGDPAVSNIAFPVGGHNYRNYAAYLPLALRWSAKSWAL